MTFSPPPVSILSCAGTLPADGISIDIKNNEDTVFSHGHSHLQERRIWRLKDKCNISKLMISSLLTSLQLADLVKEQLDYVIISLVWPENILEPEILQLSSEAGLECPVVSLNSGTNGGANAVEFASGLLANPEYRYVAVISACCYSFWFRPEDPSRSLLSDGAACMIVGKDPGIELINCYTSSTHEYSALQFHDETHKSSISYSAEAGDFIIKNLPDTIAKNMKTTCQQAGISPSDIRALHVYDPIHWVSNLVSRTLSLDKERFINLFQYYGSLGPAQNFFGLIHMLKNSTLSPGDYIALAGFGPAATTTTVLMRFREIPYSIEHDNY